MKEQQQLLKRLSAIDKELVLYDHITSLLHWDQETYMPSAGVDERSEQIGLLSRVMHEKMTAPEIGSILSDLGASDNAPNGDEQLKDADRALVREYYREYSRQSKLPSSWVQEFSETTSKAQSVWSKAKQQRDFSEFEPYLKHIVKLNRDKAQLLGYEQHPYDPLLDEFEPGMTTSEVERVFQVLKEDLVRIVEKIGAADEIDDSFLYREYPESDQGAFGRMVLSDMGFDFSRGRLDVSAHPFTTGIGRDDTRITTRYSEPSVADALFSTIHEGGHALYELGAAKGKLGKTSLGTGTSLAVHESQSRMWENMIGRSSEFWSWYYPLFQRQFPEQTEGVEFYQFLRAVNKVQPSCIRVNADEVTYGLHIILRFELEKMLMTGDLEVSDLPEAWNRSMENLVGTVPEHDGEGVLQDVHWSAGMIGYFPTYALGNLFAAQFFAAMKHDLPDIDQQISQGEFKAVLGWLHEHIHQHGAVYQAPDLLQRVTGSSLEPRYFTEYLQGKYKELTGL